MKKNNYKNKHPIVIVGAGISGLIAGRELLKRGYKILIVEKENEIGGLAKSFSYENFTFDIGPHRFFTTNQEVNNYLKQFKELEYEKVSRNTGVYLEESYYNWPLKPEVFLQLPLELTMKAGLDLFTRNKKKSSNKQNFKQYIESAYGTTIYENFFKDYNEKFFGLNNKNVHADWAKESVNKALIDKRISMKHLGEVLNHILFSPYSNIEFMYPKGGIGRFCKVLGKKIKEDGGEILTNCKVDSLTVSDNQKITSISCDNRKIFPHRVIWTGSLLELCKLLDINVSFLNYLHLLIYNFELKRPVEKEYQWAYFGSKDLIFNRITNPAKFSKGLFPEGRGGLCVEVTFNNFASEQNEIEPWNLLPEVIKGLKQVGYIKSSKEIKTVHNEIVKDAYPIYHLFYKKNLDKCFSEISRFKNLFLTGRTALFWYNNMDECIKNSIKLVEKMTGG